MSFERFFLRRHRVVNAGAGTGKTHALLTQYLHLLSGLSVHGKPLEPRALCALTFTEKAAGEMRERLGRRLLGIVRALAEKDASEKDPLFALRDPEPDLVKSAAELSRGLPELRHFESARDKLSSAPIGTFHSFAAALLRRHAVSAALDPDFVLLDEDTARDLLEEVSERVVLSALEGELGEALATATAQLIAEYGFRGGAYAEGGIALALCRLYWARAEEGRDAADLAAAYTPEALDRERLRLRAALCSDLRALFSLSSSLTAKSAERAAELGNLADTIERALSHPLPGEGEPFVAAKSPLPAVLPLCESLHKELGRLRAPKGKSTENSAVTAEELRALIDSIRRSAAEVRALFHSLRAAPLALGLLPLLSAVTLAYAAQKQKSAALDFTDLLRQARDLLRDNPAVRKSEQGRYAALLVDEFQDTNPLQADLLRLIVGFDEPEDETAALGPRRLYLVGDRKQSIYGFRGADVTAYERLCQELLNAGADEETLNVSRRSRPSLLSSENALFSRVFSGEGKKELGHISWDPVRDPLLPFREDPDSPGPLVELLRENEPEKSEPGRDDPPPINREARLIARRIVALCEGGVRHGEIVLLLRRFTHLLRYTAALKQAGIPHYVVRGRGFYQAQEVLDLSAFLTLLDDLDDRLALLSVLRSPLCGLSDESLARLHLVSLLSLPALLRGGLSEVESPKLSLPRDEASRLGRLLGLYAALLRCGDRLGPTACLRTLFDHTDYLGILYADPDGEQRVANVMRLLERARACEARGGNLRSFVRALRRDADPRLSELFSERDEPIAPVVSEAEDVVRVMTVHQAKGLEFPVVFVAGCASPERVSVSAIAYDRSIGVGLKLDGRGERADTLAGLLLHERGKLRSAAESARLFYVAATRARERLIFSGENRRGRRTLSGTWLFHIENLIESDAGSTVWQPPKAAPEKPLAPAEHLIGDSPVLLLAAERQVTRVYAPFEAPERKSSADVSLDLFAAADLLTCGRRFHLLHMLHLHEQDAVSAPGRGEDPPGTLGLFTLAAEILDQAHQLDLPSQKSIETAVQSLLLSRGQDVRSLAVSELFTRLVRFLHSGYVAKKRTASLHSAVFCGQEKCVKLFPGCWIRKTLDLVIKTKEPVPRVEVFEYRYGYAPDAPSPLERTRQTLLWLLSRQVFAEDKVQVGAFFLREADPRPHFYAAPNQAEIEETLARAKNLASLVSLGNVAALRLPVLPSATCEALGCGYRFLCHRVLQMAVTRV